MLMRLQQITELGKLDNTKRKSAKLLNEKLQEKVLGSIPHIDCEDLL